MAYIPTLGRFLQEDPAGYINGPDEYQCDGSDPISRIDPAGEWFYNWTNATARAQLASLQSQWVAKGMSLQANLVGHFLANTGTKYILTANDALQVSNDSDFSDVVKDAIINEMRNRVKNGWKPCKEPFQVKAHVNHSFVNVLHNMFWAFHSLNIDIDGYGVDNGNGTYTIMLDANISKTWDFDYNHSWVDDLAPSFDAGQWLQYSGGGSRFNLQGRIPVGITIPATLCDDD